MCETLYTLRTLTWFPRYKIIFPKIVLQHVLFSGSLIFCPGISCQGLHWVVVTTGVMWRSWSGSEPELPLSTNHRPAWLLRALPLAAGVPYRWKAEPWSIWLPWNRPRDSGQVDRALWAFKKKPWNVKKLWELLLPCYMQKYRWILLIVNSRLVVRM